MIKNFKNFVRVCRDRGLFVKKFFLILLSFIFFPFSAVAENNVEERLVVPDPLQMEGLEGLFEDIVFAILIILLAVLPLIFLYGAFKIMTSEGDPEKVGKAKKIMKYAALGLIIVLLARAVVPMIRHMLGE